MVFDFDFYFIAIGCIFCRSGDCFGIGIAMGSSRPELKEVAKYITKPFLEDGVAYAIDCLINGEFSKLEIKE